MGTVLNREEKQKLHIHNNKMFVKAALSTLLVCSSQAGWQQHLARQASKPAGNLVEELAANGASTLIDFAVKAGLADTLTGEGPSQSSPRPTLPSPPCPRRLWMLSALTLSFSRASSCTTWSLATSSAAQPPMTSLWTQPGAPVSGSMCTASLTATVTPSLSTARVWSRLISRPAMV